jgi:predicted nuclease of predicted toxin-antitoxin system
MAHFYADENFDYGVVERLRALGNDVLTVQEAGEQAGDDARVLARATSDGRCVLTFDHRDFKRLHRQNPTHSGIITCTRDRGRDGLASRIDQAARNAGTLAGKLIRVTKPQKPP